MKTVKFGTDGWRAIMAREFTFDNLRLVVQAVASYLVEEGRNGKVVVGYDQRFLSDKFAVEAAEVLAGNGIHVLLNDKPTPTPTTAFAIKEYGAEGALMITASHNPPEYNGIKFIPYYAGPATPDITDGIELKLHNLTFEQVKVLPRKQAEAEGLLELINPIKPYLAHLHNLINWEYVNKTPTKVIVDPMFGAGIGYLDQFLCTSCCAVNTIHGSCDPLFGGGMPEPMGSSLQELVQKVKESGAYLGLALDGDADRFGAVDGDGTYYSPNQILSLLLHHLIVNRGWSGPVARTVATTHLLDKICEHHNLRVFETPVGFKYIAQHLLHNDCILGGEESGGLSIRGHIPEKDGILACLLIIEMVGYSGKSLGQLMQELYNRYGKLISERLDVHVEPAYKPVILAALKEYAPVKLNGQPVIERITVDGTKLKMANGSWVLIRPSGTEPLFRIYVEAGCREELKRLQDEVKGDLGI
ncbi:MAG: phosphoglucomutase/phosphomannomutase family protein [Bacillota bacterium]